MVATDVKDWKTLNEFVYEQVSGKDSTPLSENDVEFLNKKAREIFSNLKVEDIRDDVNAMTEVNILDKKSDLSIFQLVPEVWTVYYSIALENN